MFQEFLLDESDVEFFVGVVLEFKEFDVYVVGFVREIYFEMLVDNKKVIF